MCRRRGRGAAATTRFGVRPGNDRRVAAAYGYGLEFVAGRWWKRRSASQMSGASDEAGQ